MQDTNIEIIQKQREIIFSKTPTERFKIGDDLILLGREIVESSIKQQQPDISIIDLKLKVFKRCYESVFTKAELDNIISAMFVYYSKINSTRN